jgi:xylulokinase
MPPPTAYFLGIDVARSGLGLVVLSGDGSQVAALHRAYGGGNDQLYDPQDWWRAARTGIKEILRRADLKADQIRCIGVTGDSEGMVALSKDGKVLCLSSLGADPRAEPQVDLLNRTVGARNLINLASGPAHAGASAVKLLWLRENEKRVWHDLGVVLSPKDFLRFRLCETLVTDASDAAASLLFNPKTRAWSKQLLTLLDINPAWLPSISSGQLISGRVTSTAAREAGLQSGTPVITGAGHAASAAIAAAALTPGSMMAELGGIGGIFAPTSDAVRDPSGRLVSTCHSVAGTWALSQSDLASAEPLDWLQQHVFTSEVMQAKRAQRDPLEPLAELAAETPPGADGLLYVSAKQSSRLAGFLGLNRRHGRGHLVRAVLESGALAIGSALNALTDLKREPEEVLVVGPGAANTLWCQIIADAVDRQIYAIPGAECAASGAAILASSAVGLHKNITEACEKMTGERVAYQPRKAATDVYRQIAPVVARLPQAATTAFADQVATAAEAQS